MSTPKRWRAVAAVATLTIVGTPAFVASAGQASGGDVERHEGPSQEGAWAGSWAAAVTRGNATGLTNTGLNNQSVRMVVHTSLGGDRLRIRLSNIYGEQAVRVGHATVAMPNTQTTDDLSDINPETVRELTFGGASTATMPRGAELLSDPVDLPLGDQQDLVVTLYFPTATGPTTFHGQSQQTNFIGATDLSTAAGGSGFTIRPNCCWFFLSGVDVQRRHAPGSVIVFSDSMGDGNGSTVNANRRWPDLLADRLIDDRPDVRTPGVLNLSLAGNRLNHEGAEPGAGGFPGYHQLGSNALSRLNEDVFAQTGARTVITHLGINDIWMTGDSAEAIIATLRQVNQQVKQRGLTSLVATLAPYEGHGNPGVWTPEKEATRQAVNAYLRNNAAEFDGLVDFDAALRDPEQPSRLRPDFDSGDHIHPNDAGNQAMADAVQLRLLDL